MVFLWFLHIFAFKPSPIITSQFSYPSSLPRWPKTAPSPPKTAPRWPQDGPKTAPRWPKTTPSPPIYSHATSFKQGTHDSCDSHTEAADLSHYRRLCRQAPTGPAGLTRARPGLRASRSGAWQPPASPGRRQFEHGPGSRAAPERERRVGRLAPRTSHLAPRTSHPHLPGASHLAPRTSHLVPRRPQDGPQAGQSKNMGRPVHRPVGVFNFQ